MKPVPDAASPLVRRMTVLGRPGHPHYRSEAGLLLLPGEDPDALGAERGENKARRCRRGHWDPPAVGRFRRRLALR